MTANDANYFSSSYESVSLLLHATATKVNIWKLSDADKYAERKKHRYEKSEKKFKGQREWRDTNQEIGIDENDPSRARNRDPYSEYERRTRQQIRMLPEPHHRTDKKVCLSWITSAQDKQKLRVILTTSPSTQLSFSHFPEFCNRQDAYLEDQRKNDSFASFLVEFECRIPVLRARAL